METIKEILYTLGSYCAKLIGMSWDWFNGLDLLNKIIVLNTFTALFAVVLPIAKYYIFESWFEINNPVALYLVLISGVMFATVFFRGFIAAAVRVILNLWYLVWIIIVASSHGISHAPYVLSTGFYFNLIAPLVYMIAAVMVFISEN